MHFGSIGLLLEQSYKIISKEEISFLLVAHSKSW
jgi:hypothetical protein